MACQAIRNWTFSGLVGAFLDLAIAYLLLCASTVAFFASKFLGIFGLCLPCPCNGLFGNPNRSYCAQRLLLECPTGQVSSVQFSTKNKLPFDSIFAKDQNSDSNMKLIGDGINTVDGFVEYEREASCSSISDARKSQIVVGKESVDMNQNEVKEWRFDGKGKGVINQRAKGVIRHRRKGGVDVGKLSSTGSTWDLLRVNRQGFSQSIYSTKEEQSEAVQGGYEVKAPMKSGERALDVDFQLSQPLRETSKPNELKLDHEENTIVALKRKLEEEHTARAALNLELEEERNAAASAADEAMAMILRLQEEKASIEMEARQYQRMIEEKAAYDLEEMDILKEILLRREKEKHFLEKEVESYRQQMNYENEEFEGGFWDPHEDPSLMLHQLSESIDKNPIRGWDEYGNGSKQGKNLEREFSHVLKCVSDCHQEFLHEKKMISVENEGKILEASSQEHNSGQNCQSIVSEEEEMRVHDVHVIDFNRNSPSKSVLETEMTTTGLPPMGPRGVPVIQHLRRNSTSALDTERLKIESEVGWLRERLRVVQEGREKLNLSVEYREREKLQLQLLEDIVLQLQEIRQWTTTDEHERAVRQVSLPLPSSKVISKKKRCRSVSLGVDKSS